jgi:hypothetical protein
MSSYLDALYSNNQFLPQDMQYVWWRAAPDDADADEEYVEAQRATSLFSCAKILEAAQREVHEQNLWAAQLYANRELAAFDWGTGQLYKASLAPISRVGENIVKRVVDTLVSQVGKNRPKPKPVARGASWSTRQMIRKLDKFLYGTFQHQGAWTKGKRIFRDGEIFGLGCLEVKVEEDPNTGACVCLNRVFPDEILVDQMEIVACGRIRHFYRRRALPIEVVAATYNIPEEELKELPNNQYTPSTYLDYRPVGAGWTIVIEGYQLADYEGGEGRYCVATERMILDEGEWRHDWLPYVFYQYNDPISGFYSPGVVEEALPYQIRLNEINEVIRDAQDLMGRPRILVAEGSRVNPLEVDNLIGRFIKYTGIKPEAITWPAINAELYNERERCIRTCLEHFGLSNLATTVTPPPGARFDSSPAFREFNAIQDDRLADPAQRFEEFYLNVAKTICRVIMASGKDPVTTWYSGYKNSRSETIRWSEMKYDMDSYVMSMEAVSIYSMSPAAARDELEKQLAMGLISPEEYRLEMADPDQESAYSLAAAAAEDLNRVQELLESGEYEHPIPEQDLVNGIPKMTLAMLQLSKYDDDGDPDSPRLADIQMNFLNWLAEAKAIVQQGAQPSAQTSPVPSPDSVPPVAPGVGGQPGMMPGLGGPATIPVPEPAGLAGAGGGKFTTINYLGAK